jgi:acetoacetate decarboxylase
MQAFAMPLSSPAFPCGPYRYTDREYLIVTYRTDPDKLAALIPAPLEMVEPIVRFEFIRMPDSTGFGDYTESGQVIPVSFRGELGGYTHAMYLNDYAPIAGGRELWGFPKKLAAPELKVDKDHITGVLRYPSLDLLHHALAPVAALPVREVISGVHIVSDLTLGLGKVVYDYLDAKKVSL